MSIVESISAPPIQWIPRITLLFLLATAPSHIFNGTGWRRVATELYRSLIVVGLFTDATSSSAAFWLVLTGLHFAWVLGAYAIADNHYYLEGYWCLAIAIAVGIGGDQGAISLAASGGGLIALCFVLATIAKVLNPSYRDGTFFAHTLLFDNRFLIIATHCGVTPEILQRHAKCKTRLRLEKSKEEYAPVPVKLRRNARILTWWTIAIEAIVAAAFVLPAQGLELLRILTLLVFVITTYVLVPVPTFGIILLLMLSATIEDVGYRLFAIAMALVLPLMAPLSSAAVRHVGRSQGVAR